MYGGSPYSIVSSIRGSTVLDKCPLYGGSPYSIVSSIRGSTVLDKCPLHGGSLYFRVSSIRGSTVLVMDRTSVLCMEVVLFSECPLSEVPLY